MSKPLHSVAHEVVKHEGHVCTARATVTMGKERAVADHTYDVSDASELGRRVLRMEAEKHPMAALWRNRLDRVRTDLPRRARQKAELAALAKMEKG